MPDLQLDIPQQIRMHPINPTGAALCVVRQLQIAFSTWGTGFVMPPNFRQ
jgi:hypothetical protein